MVLQRCNGLVLKEMAYGEDSKLLTVFSDVHGKVTVFARGAKKQTCRFLAASQLFCYSEMELTKGRNMYNLSHARLLESFYSLREDLDVLTTAGSLAKVTLRVIQEDQEDRESLRLLLNTLYYLKEGRKVPVLLSAIYRIRLLWLQGWIPDLEDCDTGEELQRILAFSLPPLSRESVAVVKYICQAPLELLFRFRVSEPLLPELERLGNCLAAHFIEGE